MKNIKDLLKKRIIILDGATGTELQRRGMPQGVCPELWCLKYPDVIKEVHTDYAKAGSDIVYTCTFGANRLKLGEYKARNVRKINRNLVTLARKAVGRNVLVAGDIGPTGKFIEPFGHVKFENAVNIFKEQIQGLLDGGVDLFVIETMMDIQEARAALIAVREMSDKFVAVSMTYEKDGRTLNGTCPVTALITLQSLGADAVGCNCSTGPEEMLSFVEAMKPYAKVPLIAKPNAGMPKLVRGKTAFDMPAGKFASFSRDFATKGANFLGGCCGTTPEHIKDLKKAITGKKPVMPAGKSISALSSSRKYIVLEKNRPLSIVGECINPTGKKSLQKDLRKGKLLLVRQLAKEQERNGADLLDVNAGISGIDEKKTLKNITSLLSVITELPLVIDSSNIKAVEAALRLCPGRALINSISGERRKLKRFLSLGAKYGAMFILLPLDEKGMPESFEKRCAIIRRVLKEAKRAGFSKEDIVIDGMATTVSSHPSSAEETLKTISWSSDVLKTNTIIGLSNISFGMPKRPWINAAYLSMAEMQGLTMVLANPMSAEVMNIKKAADLLLKKDKGISAYISRFAGDSSVRAKDDKKITPGQEVFRAVMEGNKEDVKRLVEEALKKGTDADKLVHDIMIPAIEKVGDLFDRKEYFLPQLIGSAETMKIAFNRLRPHLKKKTLKGAKKTVVILATVEGDIHDIGKNIVALMLKNHGFSVVDLGRDVGPGRIIREIMRHREPIVGLSALMTTTMVNMKEVIALSRKKGLKCRFIAGGAVVSRSYARSIGAGYAGDGVEAVRVAKKLST